MGTIKSATSELSAAPGLLPARKVGVRHPLPLHPHRSQGISNRHGHGRAIHRSIQHHGPLGQDRPVAKAAVQMGSNERITALAAVGEQQNHIIRPHDPKIPMQGIHQANRGEGGTMPFAHTVTTNLAPCSLQCCSKSKAASA